MNARSIPFLKMNGLGNDFVVWDARDEPLRLPVVTIRTIGDRATGIGFDQMITVETSPACPRRAVALRRSRAAPRPSSGPYERAPRLRRPAPRERARSF